MINKYVIAISLAACATQSTFAQWINCSATSIPGELPSSEISIIPVGNSTTAPSYSVVPSGNNTPTNEFAITRSDVMALDNLGFELLGADDDGVFNPEDFGILAGQGFCITPVSYDRDQIRLLLDSIFLNNSVCCPILNLASEGFCDTLTNLGYTSGSDLNNLNDVFRVISLFASTETISLEGFVFQITEVNNAAAILPENCGSTAFPFCYAVRFPFTQQCFNYGPLSVNDAASLKGLNSYYNGSDLVVEVQSMTAGLFDLRVSDLAGRTVSQASHMLGLGPNRFQIPFAASGVYLVHLSNAFGQSAVTKVAVR